MTPLQNLYYAIGELAYAMASADGEVQKAERQKFHDIVTEELNNEHFGFDLSIIIFQIMDKERVKTKDAYNWAMNQMRINSHYLSPKLKETFIRILEKIAEAYPPVTAAELVFLEKFKNDMSELRGDPVYYL